MRVTLLGHAAILLETRRARVVADPWLLDPIFGGLVRHAPPAARAPEDLGRLDAILLTHDHEDHFHEESLRRLPKTAAVLVPRSPVSRLAERAEALGFLEVREMDPWETRRIGDLEAACLPSPRGFEHCTWMFESGGVRVFDGGDMLEDEAFLRRLAERPIDLAFLPVSGFQFPGMPRGVMGPKEAAWAASVLRPGLSVPGAYQMEWFALEHRAKNRALMPGGPEEFLHRLRDAAPELRARVMLPGDVWEKGG